MLGSDFERTRDAWRAFIESGKAYVDLSLDLAEEFLTEGEEEKGRLDIIFQ